MEPTDNAPDVPHDCSDECEHKCSYCEAIKVSEDKRTAGMRAVVEQEKLQLEISTLTLRLIKLDMLESDLNATIGNFIGMREDYIMKVCCRSHFKQLCMLAWSAHVPDPILMSDL